MNVDRERFLHLLKGKTIREIVPEGPGLPISIERIIFTDGSILELYGQADSALIDRLRLDNGLEVYA